jgi:hypothetical protein
MALRQHVAPMFRPGGLHDWGYRALDGTQQANTRFMRLLPSDPLDTPLRGVGTPACPGCGIIASPGVNHRTRPSYFQAR